MGRITESSVFDNNVINPITGKFGTGNIKLYPASGTFTVPKNVTSVRVRLWGGGSSGDPTNGGGGGGGFALKVITGLTPLSVIPVTVGGTSSFGAYVSATGGSTPSGGIGVGGDINYSGGNGAAGAYYGGGGGAAGLFGNGGSAGSYDTSSNKGISGGSLNSGGGGGGGSSQTGGGNGISGSGASPYSSATPGNYLSIDYISTGGGGMGYTPGANGGGGGYSSSGGFPGGGGGSNFGSGSPGLVIIEY